MSDSEKINSEYSGQWLRPWINLVGCGRWRRQKKAGNGFCQTLNLKSKTRLDQNWTWQIRAKISKHERPNMKKDLEQYATFKNIFLHIYHIRKTFICCLGWEEHISLQVSRSFQVQSVPFLMKNKSWRESLQFSSSDYCMTGTSTGSNKDSKYCNKVHWCNSSWIFWIEGNFAILSEQRDASLFPTCFLCATVSSQGRPPKAAAELIQQKFSSCSKSLKESALQWESKEVFDCSATYKSATTQHCSDCTAD